MFSFQMGKCKCVFYIKNRVQNVTDCEKVMGSLKTSNDSNDESIYQMGGRETWWKQNKTLCESEKNHKNERLNSSGGGNKGSVKRHRFI